MAESSTKPSTTFKIHFKCPYGRALYLYFITESDSKRDVRSAIRLNWTPEDYWTVTPELPSAGSITLLHYKYVIANWDRPEEGDLQWEQGLNRCLRLKNKEKRAYVIEDKWEHQKFEVIVPNILGPEADRTKALGLSGSLVDLALHSKVVKLNFTPSKQKSSDASVMCWKSPSVWVSLRTESISFSVYILDLVAKSVINNRRVDLHYLLNPEKAVQGLQKDIRVKQNCIQIVQEEISMKNFIYNEINERILVGAAINEEREKELLALEKIGAILSLETPNDKEYHPDHSKIDGDIPFFRFPIEDCTEDVIHKAAKAAHYLNSLVESQKRVYVHCTYGIARSIYVVITYLCLYEGMEIAQAIRKVTTVRYQAHPKEVVVQRILEEASILNTKLDSSDLKKQPPTP